MSRRITIRTLAALSVIVLLGVGYLLTVGQCFLPFRRVETFQHEQLEIRVFSGFAIPDQSKTVSGLLARVKWRALNPGQVRLLAEAGRIERSQPGANHILRRSLEGLGYTFPAGCYARSGDNIPMEITHYPSVLNRIQRDLHLRVAWRAAIGPDGEPLPNPTVQR